MGRSGALPVLGMGVLAHPVFTISFSQLGGAPPGTLGKVGAIENVLGAVKNLHMDHFFVEHI